MVALPNGTFEAGQPFARELTPEEFAADKEVWVDMVKTGMAQMRRPLAPLPGHELHDCSPEARLKVMEMEKRWQLGEITLHPEEPPYWLLEPGQSLAYKAEDVNLGSLRVKMHAAGKRMGRIFSVLVHKDSKSIEVARIL